jgi:DNA replication protein DnaC
MTNLEYLQWIFEMELEVRRERAIARARKISNLPQVAFDKNSLHDGVRYQVEKLEKCGWAEKSENILISGSHGSGKTALAVHIASAAIDKSFKVLYLKLDELFLVLKNKDNLQQARITYGRIKSADVLVLDEFLYLDLPKQDLELLYKTLMGINSTTSIVYVANREFSDWIASSEDKYTTQLLIQRALASSELVSL